MSLIVLASIVAVLGCLLTLRGLWGLFSRPLRASVTTTTGVTLAIIGLIGIASAVNIASYARLTEERPIARLKFYQSGPQEFNASLSMIGNSGTAAQHFVLAGDEWRLEGKMIKWQGYGNLLGLDTLFKLDRISGRYRDAEQERQSVRTLYQLSTQPGLDLWSKAQRVPLMAHLLDARYGTGTYLPMRDQAEYLVSVSQSGLVARPTNEPAAEAIGSWF